MPLMPVSETPEKVMFCVTGYTRSAAISETRIIFLEKQFANHVLSVKNSQNLRLSRRLEEALEGHNTDNTPKGALKRSANCIAFSGNP